MYVGERTFVKKTNKERVTCRLVEIGGRHLTIDEQEATYDELVVSPTALIVTSDEHIQSECPSVTRSGTLS